jgi:hypothetical protein
MEKSESSLRKGGRTWRRMSSGKIRINGDVLNYKTYSNVVTSKGGGESAGRRRYFGCDVTYFVA